MKHQILVIVAHPDDEVLGCGGTIARRAREGDEIFIAVFGEGITSRYENREQAPRRELEHLRDKSRQVAKILGAKDLFLHDLPDNRFDTLPLLDIVKKVEALVEKVQPDIVYTHHGGDLNIDHVIINRAVLTATRPVREQPVREIYSFEVPSSSEWAFSALAPAFQPDTFVDIHQTLAVKLNAMRLYESEVRAFPHPRSLEALEVIARTYGSAVGLDAAERFQLIRKIVR